MIPRCGPSSTQLQNIFFLRSIAQMVEGQEVS
jgi:hypothetical protein